MPIDKFIVIKREDADRYLPLHDKIDLDHILRQINKGREKGGKSINFYAVINTDEPYFEEIKAIMKKYGHWEEDVKTIKENQDCKHKNAYNEFTIEYNSVYEMRNSEMHCTLCGKSGSRKELTEV